jgi:hypothetical protein
MIEQAFRPTEMPMQIKRKKKKETTLAKNSTSSEAATPTGSKRVETNPETPVEVGEISSAASQNPSEGLSSRVLSRSNSGASTHPTG